MQNRRENWQQKYLANVAQALLKSTSHHANEHNMVAFLRALRGEKYHLVA